VPFTISHAAAVLPLQRITRSRVPLAALMIGSMAPDFAYFLPVSVARTSTHDFDGLFLFCWPVGLAVWLLFVKVLERPTIELLPAAWRERVPRSLPVTPRALLLASLGVIIGAMTHIAWDAFTHRHTPVSDLFPILGTEVFSFRGRTLYVYMMLQVLSSVVGLLALAWWGYNLRHAPPRARPTRYDSGFLTDRARIVAASLVIGVSGATGLVSFVIARNEGMRIEHCVYYMLISGMIAWLATWCVVAVMINQVAQRASVTTMKR
jgi:hypothetical protein